MSDVLNRYQALKGQVTALKAQRESALRELTSLRVGFDSMQKLEIQMSQAANLLREVAERCEATSKGMIERIVGHGLKVIFGEQDRFSISVETKARAVQAYMCLGEDEKGQPHRSSILDSRGGGYVDVISVLTVLVMMLQTKPHLQRILILDESFAEVGGDHLNKVGEFLQFLVKKLGLTILLITHSQELVDYADRLYEVDMVEGSTRVKEKKQ